RRPSPRRRTLCRKRVAGTDAGTVTAALLRHAVRSRPASLVPTGAGAGTRRLRLRLRCASAGLRRRARRASVGAAGAAPAPRQAGGRRDVLLKKGPGFAGAFCASPHGGDGNRVVAFQRRTEAVGAERIGTGTQGLGDHGAGPAAAVVVGGQALAIALRP